MASDEHTYPDRLRYIDGRVDRAALHHALLHVESLIADGIARERKARAANQSSLSIALLGRVGGLSELRALLQQDFWDCANGRGLR